jgi:hypothetical protein
MLLLAHDQPFSIRFPLMLIETADKHSRLCEPLGAFVKGKADWEVPARNG